MAFKLGALAEAVSDRGLACAVDGDADRQIEGVATLEEAGPGEISFLANMKYEKALQTTSAGAVIVAEEQKTPSGLSVLRTADPYAAITMVMVHVHGYRRHPRAGIDDQAVIDPTAVIGEAAAIQHGVTIGAGVTIGRGVVLYPGSYIAEKCRLGDDCVLYPNVVLYDGTVLGNRVTIHAGSVIGEDGLGYAEVEGKWRKIPQIGTVEIGDDVEIGSNCSIDRATLGRTVIASGTKLSNLVAIGHGTKVGEDCMLVAQVGIAGSVIVGHHVTMAGKVGVAGHLTIGDHAKLAGMTGAMKNIPAGMQVAGQPAIPIKDALRSFSLVRRLPELQEQIKKLEGQVAALREARQQAE